MRQYIHSRPFRVDLAMIKTQQVGYDKLAEDHQDAIDILIEFFCYCIEEGKKIFVWIFLNRCIESVF